MLVIVVAALVAFIGGLYFITHYKKEESVALQGSQATGNGLPPKPEERWRYIKELESRQPGVRAPTEPSAGGEVKNPNQLTDEQRQLLVQMQADMRQQPMQLDEVPWNEQTAEQRQQVMQQRQKQAAQQQPTLTQPAQPPKQMATQQQAYQDLLQTPMHTTATAPKTQQVAPVTRELEAQKPTAEKKDERRWMVQCGSFKSVDQAETVRAQLAFEGFDSRITSSNGWNRVVMGPIKGKENADGTIGRLKLAGHANCIRLASGG